VKYLHILITFFTLAVTLTSGMLAADELIHIVGKGETIYSISRLYQVNPVELMKANGISDPAKLQTGKRLVIPSSAITDNPVDIVSPISSVADTADYRIVKGDTLYNIARNQGINLQTLLDINKFSPNHIIKIGDIIKIPNKNTSTVQNITVKNEANSGKKTADLSLRWPVNAKEIAYMTGQMGVVVEGEHFESVKALIHGKVISAGPWRKFGKVAIIETAGGYFYMYGGCESLTVKVGDKITSGTELGKLGINPVSEKPQLFFMVFHSDTPIDPAKAPRAGGNAKI